MANGGTFDGGELSIRWCNKSVSGSKPRTLGYAHHRDLEHRGCTEKKHRTPTRYREVVLTPFGCRSASAILRLIVRASGTSLFARVKSGSGTSLM